MTPRSTLLDPHPDFEFVLAPADTGPSVFEQLRARLNWTQTDLAAWFGVTKLTIGRWERGQQEPPALHARVALMILGVADPRALLRMLGPKGYQP